MRSRALAFLALLSAFSLTAAAEDCGWLATSKVDQAFPDFAPWQTLVGGKAGMCKFTSDSSRAPNIFGANQTVKSSAAEAAEFVRTLKPSMAESYDVEPAPNLGKNGFIYKPKATDDPSGRSMFFVGHGKNIVTVGSLTLQNKITPAQRDAAEKLIVAGFAIADDAHAIAAATQCPYFDATLIKRLLPGKDFSVNVYGSNSCLAQAGGSTVILSIVADPRAEELLATTSAMEGGDCTAEPLPKLGKNAKLTYACKDGEPNASVRFAAGGKMFDFSFVPKAAPTPAQRATLVELAEHATAR